MVKQLLDELCKAYTVDEILPENTAYRWHKASQPNSGRLASQIKELNVNTISVMNR